MRRMRFAPQTIPAAGVAPSCTAGCRTISTISRRRLVYNAGYYSGRVGVQVSNPLAVDSVSDLNPTYISPPSHPSTLSRIRRCISSSLRPAALGTWKE